MPRSPTPSRQTLVALTGLSLLALAIVLVRTAWISDDALITLRTVLNTLYGYGPRFNIDERVQAYTHPLWFLAITALGRLIGNAFTATFVLSIGVSLAALALLMARLGRQWQSLLLVALAALLSQAFIDFSTSGLENPLSHLLVLAAYLAAARLGMTGPAGERSALPFFTFCALAYLNRPDLVVLLAPCALWVLFTQRRQPGRLAVALALAALPVIAWTAFSWLYYGLPLPNTAYAKLGTGIGLAERAAQGLRYFSHTAGTDPLTLLVIATGIALGMVRGGLDRALALGIVAYLAYVVAIGGDFMAGRFFTVPFFAALIVLAQANVPTHWAVALGAVLVGLGVAVPHTATVLSGKGYDNRFIGPSGIANERGFYYQETGMLPGLLHAPDRQAWTAPAPRHVFVTCGGMGLTSIHHGAQAHLIDLCALADPLLARLPAQATERWRVGHFYRALPANYVDSIREDRNLLPDASLSQAYDTIRLLTRAPLADPQRLQAIWHTIRHGLGPVDTDKYRRGDVEPSTSTATVPLDSLSERLDTSVPFYLHRYQVFQHALEVTLAQARTFDRLELSLDPSDAYAISALVQGQWQPLARIPAADSLFMTPHEVVLPQGPVTTDRLRLVGTGDGLYAVGHLLLWQDGQAVGR